MNPYLVTVAVIIFAAITAITVGSGSVHNNDIRNPASSIEAVQSIVSSDVEVEPENKSEVKEEPKEDKKPEIKKQQELTFEQEIERDNQQMQLYNELELKAQATQIQTQIYNAKIDILNGRIKVRLEDDESYEDLEQEKLELFYALKNGTLE